MTERRELRSLRLAEIIEILDAEVIVGGADGSHDICTVCVTDLMSDALRHSIKGAMLITSLNQAQAVRTAEIADLPVVTLVLGKHPSAEMVKLAEEKGITVIRTECSMFSACGKLYQQGLRSCLEA